MALTPKTGADIIADFETQVDDMTELSTEEEYMVLDRVYRRILSAKDWLFLMKPLALTTDGTDRITLPTDFGSLRQVNPAVPSIAIERREYLTVKCPTSAIRSNSDRDASC